MAEVTPASKKKARLRQQKVCSDCHKRKMKCNKETPCDNCIKRGHPEACHVANAVEELKQRLLVPRNGSEAEERSSASSGTGRSSSDHSPAGTQSQAREGVSQDPPQIGLLFLGPGSSSRIFNEFRSADFTPEQTGDPEPIVGDTMLFERFANRPSSGVFSNLGNAGTAGISDAFTALLPVSSDCYVLLDEYYRSQHSAGMQFTMPRCCLQATYDELWSQAPTQDNSEDAAAARLVGVSPIALPGQLSFLAFLFISLAIGGTVRARSESVSRPQLQQLCTRMFEYSRLALLESDTRERPSLCTIASLVLHTVWIKMVSSPSVGWSCVGQAIRHAHALGLHRDPQTSPTITPFEAEIRRRIWWTLVHMDKSQSVAFGRPYLIQSRHCNVCMPANIYRDDFVPQSLRNLRPRSECTETISLLCNIQISHILERVADEVLLGETPPYSTILSIDDDLTKMDAELPSTLRNPSPEERASKPFLEDAFTSYLIQWYHVRIMLHRSLLMRTTSSRYQAGEVATSARIAVQASQKWIALLRETETLTSRNSHSLAYALSCFEPGLTLSVVLLRGDLPEKRQSIIMPVQDVMRLLGAIQRYNPAAHAALTSLKELEKRYAPVQQNSAAAVPAETAPSLSYPVAEGSSTTSSLQFFGGLSVVNSFSTPSSLVSSLDATTQEMGSSASRPTGTLEWPGQEFTVNSQQDMWPVSMPLLAGDSDFNEWLNQIMRGLPA